MKDEFRHVLYGLTLLILTRCSGQSDPPLLAPWADVDLQGLHSMHEARIDEECVFGFPRVGEG